jgi:hypothetical protein
MAELLVKAISNSHIDPTKDQRGCYKRGDVVVVMPDGHQWGKEEHPQTTTHREPQTATQRWNKIDWLRHVSLGSYDEFTAKPTILSEESPEESINVSVSRWGKMQASLDFYPFPAEPTAMPITEVIDGPAGPGEITVGYQLTGVVDYVNLQGEVLQSVTKRKYKYLVDDLPQEDKDSIDSGGEVSGDFTKNRDYIQDKSTGLTE